MNIYEKLQAMRCDLQGAELKKSGYNKFAGYNYFDLSDFLPTINALMLSYKVCSAISYGVETATLVLTDAEKPGNTITFTSPMSSASLKGCHEVQNLGAVQTYLRRYLYTTAFEIVEHDALDSTQGKPVEAAQKPTQAVQKAAEAALEATQQDEPAKQSMARVTALYKAAEVAGKSMDDVKKVTQSLYGCAPYALTDEQYEAVMKRLVSKKASA